MRGQQNVKEQLRVSTVKTETTFICNAFSVTRVIYCNGRESSFLNIYRKPTTTTFVVEAVGFPETSGHKAVYLMFIGPCIIVIVEE